MDNSSPLFGNNVIQNNPAVNNSNLPPIIPPSPVVPINKPSKHNILAFVTIPVFLILLTVGFIASQKTTEYRSKAAHPLDCTCVDGFPVGNCWEPIDCSYTPPPAKDPRPYCAGGGQPESSGRTGCCPLFEPDSSGTCAPKPGVDLCIYVDCFPGQSCNPETGYCIADLTAISLTPISIEITPIPMEITEIISKSVMPIKIDQNIEYISSLNTLVDTVNIMVPLFGGKGKMNGIIVTDKTDAAYIDSENNIVINAYLFGVNGQDVIAHELTHVLQLTADPSFMKTYDEAIQWTCCDEKGTGLALKPPPNYLAYQAQNNDFEDMAVASQIYVLDLRFDGKSFEETDLKRYNFLKNNVFGGKSSAEMKELIYKGKRSYNILNQILIGLLKPKYILAQEAQTAEINSPIFTSVKPGFTSKAEILNLFGNPFKTYTDSKKTIFWYKSEIGQRFHTIIMNNQKVYFTTVFLENSSYDNIANYGQYDFSTSNIYREGTQTYFYNNLGLALTAGNDGRIYVKQFFIPNTVDEILSQYDNDYPRNSLRPVSIISESPIPSVFPNVTLVILSPTIIISTSTQAVSCNKSHGDANCDGIIDQTDFDIWKKNVGKFGNSEADFNQDSRTDLVDFEILRRSLFSL